MGWHHNLDSRSFQIWILSVSLKYLTGAFYKTSLLTFFSPLSVIGPPDSPSISNLTVHGNNCSLQWTEPYHGKSPITMYTIHVWKIIVYLNGSLFWKKIKTWNTTKTLSLMLNLEWNHNYTVAVSAWNKYGKGSSSIKERCEIGRDPQGSDCLLLLYDQFCVKLSRHAVV